MRNKFHSLIEEHKTRLEYEMNRKREDLKRELEEQVIDELAKTERTQQQYEFYESEVEATLQKVREELNYMESKQKVLTEEVLQLKTQNAELRLNNQKDETELQVKLFCILPIHN